MEISDLFKKCPSKSEVISENQKHQKMEDWSNTTAPVMEQCISTIHNSAYCFFTTCEPRDIYAEMVIKLVKEENIKVNILTKKN
jgi:hypothetical protein